MPLIHIGITTNVDSLASRMPLVFRRLPNTPYYFITLKRVCLTVSAYLLFRGIEMIDELMQKLSTRTSSSTVFNPYSNQKIAYNLKLYFEYMLKNQDDHVVLVGEAPGYAGCRITGIPFTSGVTITHSTLPVFTTIKDQLFLDEIESEQTATIVWTHLERRRKTPVFWNSFPFHPHHEKEQLSNRAPTSDEIKEGEYYIKKLIEIFRPQVIAAIGRKGEKALNNIFPDEPVIYIRHPSRGGKSQFLAGIDAIL